MNTLVSSDRREASLATPRLRHRTEDPRRGARRLPRSLVGVLTLALGFALFGALGCKRGPAVTVAVETSVAETGLVERLADHVEGVRLVPLVGTAGECLSAGYEGRADLLLISSEEELARMESAKLVAAKSVFMHNEYVLVGRPTDPARVAGMKHGALALRQINRHGASFIVPARGSAARFKLDALWKLQTDKRVSPSFLGVDGGVRDAVLTSHAQGAYTLVDRATRITFLEARGLKPRTLLQGGPEMANTYYLVLLAPVKGREARQGAARALYDQLRSKSVETLVSNFGLGRYGEALFQAGKPKGVVRAHRQMPSPVMPSRAPLRPEAAMVPSPHAAGMLPKGRPHGAMPGAPRPGAPGSLAPGTPPPLGPGARSPHGPMGGGMPRHMPPAAGPGSPGPHGAMGGGMPPMLGPGARSPHGSMGAGGMPRMPPSRPGVQSPHGAAVPPTGPSPAAAPTPGAPGAE